MNVEIPSNCGSLHPTNMNKKGNITVSHALKIIIRAEKENAGGTEDLKKKTYDIIIQYPFHLLSVSVYVVWRMVILKTDCDLAASVQQEVHFIATVLINLELRSNGARPIVVVYIPSFKCCARSVCDRAGTPHPGIHYSHDPHFKGRLEREGATNSPV